MDEKPKKTGRIMSETDRNYNRDKNYKGTKQKL